MDIIHIILNAYGGYASYLFYEIIHPTWHNYFYWLLGVSAFFFAIEWFSPWRENQPKFRKDFWLDFFYMFFNFFLFSLIIYNAASDVVVNYFNRLIQTVTGFNLQASNPMRLWPAWAILLTGFVVRDFVQWWTHRLLHRVPFLWNFHKVHHSVEQMGFAAHLRYHWMENVVYRSIEYIPLALLGVGLHDFFIIHIFTLAVGHYNHSNISIPGKITGGVVGFLIGLALFTGVAELTVLENESLMTRFFVLGGSTILGVFILGPVMKYIFNSPEMHIWHHAYELPKGFNYGINFGLTLSIWDYIFKTASIPHNGKNIRLGFPGIENFPDTFIEQAKYGIQNPTTEQ